MKAYYHGADAWGYKTFTYDIKFDTNGKRFERVASPFLPILGKGKAWWNIVKIGPNIFSTVEDQEHWVSTEPRHSGYFIDRAFDLWWFSPERAASKFEKAIKKRFKNLNDLHMGGRYLARELPVLQQAIDEVLAEMLKDGEISSREYEELNAMYDVGAMKKISHKISKDRCRWSDPDDEGWLSEAEDRSPVTGW